MTGGGAGLGAARLSAPPALLVTALAYAAFSQGAFYGRQFQTFAVLLLAAVALALWRARSLAALRGLPAVAGAIAAWAVVSAALAGDPATAAGPAALALCVVAALAVVRLATEAERERVATGVLVVGAAVALVGWFGVVARVAPLALVDQDLWRAASSLTYANATAGLLAPLAVLGLARLVHRPYDRATALTTTILLAGTAATLSRAGGLALALGAIALAVRLGPRSLLVATWRACLGAAVAFAGLLPTMPAASPARPLLAGAALGTGLAVATFAPETVPRYVLAGAVVAGAFLAWRPVADAAERVGATRISTSSPDRAGEWSATLEQARLRPWTGVGPGRLALRWQAADGRTMTALFTHNEYLQLLAEQGTVGLGLVLGAMATAAVSIRRARATGWVAVAVPTALLPLAVHSGLDFIWHIPLVPVLGATLIALGGPVSPSRRETT